MLTLACALGVTPTPVHGAQVTPPGQPAGGPGGADYAHARASVESHGSGATQYWLYLPDAPRPTIAPVIVFAHGWGAMEPKHYEAWLVHLARKGNIVIYPRYQANLRTPTRDFVPNTVTAVREALGQLESERGPIRPDRGRFAVAGHSAGGLIAANLGVALPEAGLPAPRAILSMQPAKSWADGDTPQLPVLDLAKIAPDTLLIALAGADDTLVGDRDARRVFRETTAIPLENKDFVILQSDRHGTPALIAGHRAPSAPTLAGVTLDADEDAAAEAEPEKERGRRGGFLAKAAKKRALRKLGLGDASNQGPPVVDALDYYGTWKLLDALCAAAFTGEHRNIALGGGPGQTFMGTWSDGRPVTPLRSTKQP